MFDIGWSELLLIGVAAIIVIGPKDLPRAMRQAGRWVATVRRLAGDFQSQVNEAMRETELDEFRREARSLKEEAQKAFDPVRNAHRDVQAAIEAEPAPKAVPAPKPAKKASTAAKKTAVPAKKPPAKPRAKKQTGSKA